MIELDISDGLSVITLRRPEKANALTAEMLEALCEAVRESLGSSAMILTGEGKVFSAGADLEAAQSLALSPQWERLSGMIADHRGLSIAALNGTCAGGAMGMVLACDLRIGVESAKFFYPVMRLGFLPQPSDPKRLQTLVGPSRARMILMAGQKIAAQEALTWGLLDRIVEPDALLAEARLLAGDALAATPLHVQRIGALFPS
ncbi:MAG: enoyl-CoA hydratase/isomerase family protein [Roseivivax sp.]|nr:enoyl-CoA hydratase/isomerase family protein [Roseivivax sp.]